MQWTPTPLSGVFVIEPVQVADERGFFARTFCRETFAAHGVAFDVAQRGTSFNHRRGTLRGMHFQRAPHAESKLVRCVRGALFDVALDLRPHSPTHRRWHAVTLSAENRWSFLLPPGVAHGFLTLEDATEVDYLLTPAYVAEASAGVRWDDPAFGIAWPFAPEVIAARDRTYPDYLG